MARTRWGDIRDNGTSMRCSRKIVNARWLWASRSVVAWGMAATRWISDRAGREVTTTWLKQAAPTIDPTTSTPIAAKGWWIVRENARLALRRTAWLPGHEFITPL